MVWGWTWAGLIGLGLAVLGLVATAFVAWLVYRLQRKTHDDWAASDDGWKSGLDEGVDALKGGVEDLKSAIDEARAEVAALEDLVRETAEQKAAEEKERIEADSAPEPGDDSTGGVIPNAPGRLKEYVQDLRNEGLPLDYANLTWKKKVRCTGDRRGNLGWFVDDGGDKRYFIHRGRKTTVRPAIPRRLLEAWEDETGREPCEVELDYQTGVGRGNHAWFLRTYDGTTWRVTQGGQGRRTPTVTELTDSSQG